MKFWIKPDPIFLSIKRGKNLSSRSFTEIEYKCLNYKLKFEVFPSFFNHIKVQTEFEDLCQQVKPHLNNK